MAHVLPDLFDRVQLWGSGRQEYQSHVAGDCEFLGGVPTGPIEDQDAMCAFGNHEADFVEMRLHGLGVGTRHGDGRAHAPARADGAEQVGAAVTLVGGLTWPCPAPGPLSDDTIFLANPGFVLKPYLDGCWSFAVGNMPNMGLQRLGEVFLYASITSAFWPGWSGRALT